MTSEFLLALALSPFYLIACYYFVKLAYRQGKKWHWHWVNRLLISLVVFIGFNYPVGSTFIPGLIAMQSYCNNAGFTLYKSPEQWLLENPGVAETFGETSWGSHTGVRHLDENRLVRTTRFNERFELRSEEITLNVKNLKKHIGIIVDLKTNEVLAKRLDFKLRAEPIYAVYSCFKKEERKSRWQIKGEAFMSIYLKYKKLGEQK